MNIPVKGGRCRFSLRSRDDIIYTQRCVVRRRLMLVDLPLLLIACRRKLVHNPVRGPHWLHLATRHCDLTPDYYCTFTVSQDLDVANAMIRLELQYTVSNKISHLTLFNRAPVTVYGFRLSTDIAKNIMR